MVKIYKFPEHKSYNLQDAESELLQFERAMNLLCPVQAKFDPALHICDLVTRIIRSSGANPHVFPDKDCVRLLNLA